METFSKEFKPFVLEINQFQCRHTKNFFEPFCMCSLSTFQPKEHCQNLFHLGNIKQDFSVNLIDEFQHVVFENVELEKQGKSTVIKLLPHLVDQNSRSDVKDKLHVF